MKNFLFGLIALSFVTIGCSKIVDPPNPAEEKIQDYFPMNSGANWEYYYNGPYAYEYSFTTGADTIINSKKYHTHRDEFNDAHEIFRFEGNSAYEYDRWRNDELMLKIAPVGATWNDTLIYDEERTNFAYVTSHIEAKGISLEVYGKTYNDVIQVRSKIKNFWSGGTTGEIIRDRYFAKGIGMIKEHNFDQNGESNGFFGLKNFRSK